MYTRRRITLAAALLVTAVLPAVAEVEQRLVRSLPLPGAALDVAVTADGQRTFVLLTGGTVQVLNGAGTPLGQLTVPAGATGISPAPDGSLLYVTAGSELQVVGVDLVHDIDLAGSPFRGPADAPVAVTVFTDFQ